MGRASLECPGGEGGVGSFAAPLSTWNPTNHPSFSLECHISPWECALQPEEPPLRGRLGQLRVPGRDTAFPHPEGGTTAPALTPGQTLLIYPSTSPEGALRWNSRGCFVVTFPEQRGGIQGMTGAQVRGRKGDPSPAGPCWELSLPWEMNFEVPPNPNYTMIPRFCASPPGLGHNSPSCRDSSAFPGEKLGNKRLVWGLI